MDLCSSGDSWTQPVVTQLNNIKENNQESLETSQNGRCCDVITLRVCSRCVFISRVMMMKMMIVIKMLVSQ